MGLYQQVYKPGAFGGCSSLCNLPEYNTDDDEKRHFGIDDKSYPGQHKDCIKTYVQDVKAPHLEKERTGEIL